MNSSQSSSPPSGTVTFLFTDIEASTTLAQQYPEVWSRVQDRHHALLRKAIEAQRGYVFKTIGDAFCAAFHSATDAIVAAIETQRALQNEHWDGATVRVRMGIHTGEAEWDGHDYRGYLALSVAHRVMSAGHGGQVLLSNATQDLARSRLPHDIALRDMGEHRLKGISTPEHLWQVTAAGLAQDFAPLATSSSVPNNLPATLNRFVGRVHELDEITQRLASARLLTLLGPGGTGKTRLAVQAASEMLSEFEDRIYFIDLAPSRDADSALSAIARTVGLREQRDKSLLDDLRNQIGQRKMLLLLDNFEQVIVAASAMAELLRDCPALKMLVTSREALRVRGEQIVPIPPLALPSFDTKHPSLEQLTQCEAIQLFVDRARSVKPGFQLTDENASAVVEICARLDGLPLAIELATARLNVFTPQALAERLSNRLALLRGGARDSPERQHTLRNTIAWSYEMLDASEQRVFALLAVFAGATVDTIEQVASRVRQCDELGLDVVDGVSSLVDKSLIRQVEADGESRLRMLETIRDFAVARLDEDAAFGAAVRDAHASVFAELTQSQWSLLTGDGREVGLKTLAADLENIQAAWRYWVGKKDFEQLGKFTDCLWLLYDARGWYRATVALTEDLLAVLSTTRSTAERAGEEIVLQTALARGLNTVKGYTQEAEQAYIRALELFDSVGESRQLFPVLRGLSYFYVYRAEFEKAIQIGERILKLAEHLNDPSIRMEGEMVVGYNIAFSRDLHLGIEYLEKSIAGYDVARQRVRRLGLGANPGVVCLAALALCQWMAGFPERGIKRMTEAVALSRKLDHPFSIAYALFHHALISLLSGSMDVAEQQTRALNRIAEEHEFAMWIAVGDCLRGAALVGTGSIDEGLSTVERGMNASRGVSTPPIFWPSLLFLHAVSLGMAGRPAQGLPLLDEAIEVAANGAGRLMMSEFLGLKGDLLLALDPKNAAQVEDLYRAALDRAIAVRAEMLELRAAHKLSRIWQHQNKKEAARELLSAAYAKLTEGFDSYDSTQAQALLRELA